MKNLNTFLQEMMTSGGGGVVGMHQSINPNDGVTIDSGREADRLAIPPRKKKKIRETFAGCPVFELTSDEYNKCMRGRTKYERWNKKLNMEEMGNQEIRSFAHKNPGKPVVVKDSTTGIMSYLIPPTRN